MLQASQFTPVGFEAVANGPGLTESVGRLAARLLAAHGDLIDDESGLQIPERSVTGGHLQLIFRDRGLLTVTPFWASFEGSFPVDVGPSSAAAPEPVKWAVDLLMLVVNTQKSQVKSMSFEVTWLLLGEISTAALVEHFGLSYSLGGLFASSGAFAICGDTTAELPDLFTVECDVFAGWLENSGEVGVQIKHWPQDDRFDPNSTVTFTPIVIDQFFALSPQLMQRQLAQYFPTPGDT